MDIDHSNQGIKGKQTVERKETGKRPAKKKLNFHEYQTKHRKKESNEAGKTRARKLEADVNKMVVKYIEDRDEVFFKVEGQGTEFASETEEEQTEDVEEMNASSASESEGECNSMESVNNNANKINEVVTQDESDDKVQIKPKGKDQFLEEEEQGMQRFVDYIKKQGLVIVESSQVRNKSPKFQKGKGKTQSAISSQRKSDDESVVTIYKNAVQRQSEPTEINKKRDSSSSSEGQLDTSDELDKLQMGNVNINDVNQQLNNLRLEFFPADST